MKPEYYLIRRGRQYHCEHAETGRQLSLRTSDKHEARALLNTRNEANRQPMLTVSTNLFLIQLQRFALSMNWLPWPARFPLSHPVSDGCGVARGEAIHRNASSRRGIVLFPAASILAPMTFRPIAAFLAAIASTALAPASEEKPAPRSAADAFATARANASQSAEAFTRSNRYLHGWLDQADPQTGLIPRNLADSHFWNGRDSAADNYPYMVLTAAMTDRTLFEGRMRDMLATEQRLTARVDRLVDDFSFSTRTWRRERLNLEETIFDSAEYVKDGLIPLTEWLGPSPWSDRMVGIIEDIWKHAAIETSHGRIPTWNFEVNGDLLQACSRLFWLTGESKYLEWAIRIGDNYLFGDRHPLRSSDRLRLRDHGGEMVNGLTELYVAVRHVRPERAAAYRAPLEEIFDRILEFGRNEHGMLYDWIDPRTGEHSKGIADTWGYIYDGFYTMYLMHGDPRYHDAVLKPLRNLHHYRSYRWESHAWGRDSADGYADSIEGALNLLQREPVEGVGDWIDSEIRIMWSKQREDGVIEGWHGDGNFARTSLMYALWKTKGLTVEPWRPDLRLGADIDPDGSLRVVLESDQPWSGVIRFDRARHSAYLRLPIDYPRINQFAEWYPIDPAARYVIEGPNGARKQHGGNELLAGLKASIRPGEHLSIHVRPRK